VPPHEVAVVLPAVQDEHVRYSDRAAQEALGFWRELNPP